jgi:hypothetical protein
MVQQTVSVARNWCVSTLLVMDGLAFLGVVLFLLHPAINSPPDPAWLQSVWMAICIWFTFLLPVSTFPIALSLWKKLGELRTKILFSYTVLLLIAWTFWVALTILVVLM